MKVRFNAVNDKGRTRKSNWNVFEYTQDKRNVGSSAEDTKRFRSFVRIVKFFISILVFIVILGSAVLSKLSLLFMISHVTPDREVPFCNINLPENNFIAVIPTRQTIAWIWAIIFAFAVPELGTLFRSWRFCFFKNIPRPSLMEFLLVFCAETFHVIGLALLMIVILPQLNVIQAVMLTNCFCLIPALLNIFSDILAYRTETETRSTFRTGATTFLNILAFAAQLTGLIAWPMDMDNVQLLWATPLALALISFHWWENFVSANSRFIWIYKLNKLKIELTRTRYSIYLYVSVWKIILFTGCAILFSNLDYAKFFNKFSSGWSSHPIQVHETLNISVYNEFPELPKPTINAVEEKIFSTSTIICWVLFIQVVSSYVCYIFSKFACKIKIQMFGFALPMSFTVPVSVSVLCAMCIIRYLDVCAFHGVIPDYLFFVTPPHETSYEFILDWIPYMPMLWIFSQSWITRHIWSLKSTKNASTDSLFLTPLYNGLIIDQSLALNRRRQSFSDMQQTKTSEDEQNTVVLIRPEDTIPQLYVCGTMWHEEKEEIIEFLKSILRLDEDYSSRRLATEYLTVDHNDCEYYELESHIFFDDAFGHDYTENISEDSEEINKYVTKLITCLADASLEVYKTELKYEIPKRFETPYGGRLEWMLPGGTKLIAHLKNKKKIMAKKRWSQVMYMYYLLGYRLMEKADLDDIRKTVRSENTFLLALDGDIDFQPDAVHLLMNRMKVDENLGAACGRIHPIGDGPMVWYQKFEYAIGHWLQKATEHVIGCVLCSPGCFSLFRGSALMDGGIIKQYTTISEDASNFVQYDQGEDRWLCTLILKEKYRVEYSAASDAYTHAPTGFFEFYNQRRRWIPSTMANIFDLLVNYKPIVKKNDSISMLYIIYQGIIMVGTILGPGTIFLMMIGALVAVFSIDIFSAFLYNFIPITIFMLICYRFKKIQLITALILTAVYGLVMMAVFIGVLIQVMEDGLTSPSSVFFLVVVLEIVIAGILHPKEMGCLICGVIYYITIPSMYMLLIIYSLFNMNDVSWGTRETKTEADKGATAKGSNTQQTNEKAEMLDISFFNLFRCILCPKPPTPENDSKLSEISEELHEIKSKMEFPEPEPINMPRTSVLVNDLNLIEDGEKKQNPIWLKHPLLIDGKKGKLEDEEANFWTDLIAEYLKPPKMSEAEKKVYNAEVILKLKTLRDKCVASFVMLNALFVVVVYLLQLNKEYLHIVWPYGAENEIFFDQSNLEILITREYMQIEPIGLLFVVFFGFILLVQFVAMLVHRFGTLSQILADVDVNLCNNKMVQTTSMSGMEAVKLVKKLQLPKALGDVDDTTIETAGNNMRRITIKKIMEIQKNKNLKQSSLRTIFLENPETKNLFTKLRLPLNKVEPIRRNDSVDSASSFERQIFKINTPTQSFAPESFDKQPNSYVQTVNSTQNESYHVPAEQSDTSDEDEEPKAVGFRNYRPSARQQLDHEFNQNDEEAPNPIGFKNYRPSTRNNLSIDDLSKISVTKTQAYNEEPPPIGFKNYRPSTHKPLTNEDLNGINVPNRSADQSIRFNNYLSADEENFSKNYTNPMFNWDEIGSNQRRFTQKNNK